MRPYLQKPFNKNRVDEEMQGKALSSSPNPSKQKKKKEKNCEEE
jgi:hypothetical protein